MKKTSGQIDFPTMRRNTFYKPELDVLRFVAFLLVFLHHLPHVNGLIPGFTTLQQGGRFGVSVFFTLSAYLITELLLRERERTGQIDIRSFFVRRLLRIWPLYFFALGLGLLLGHLVPVWHFPLHGALFFTLLAGNFYIAAHGWPVSGLNVLWSLSIEEQFYAVIPSITKYMGRLALGIAALLTFPAAYGAMAYIVHRNADPSIRIWVNSLVQFQFFGAGTLLALVLHGREWRPGRVVRCVFAGLAFAGFLFAGYTQGLRYAGHPALEREAVAYLAGLVSVLLLFFSVLGANLSRAKVLIRLGQISYGLYIFHDFVIRALFYPDAETLRVFHPGLLGRMPVLLEGLAFIITVALATLSFRFFEQPIARYKERFAVIKSGAGAHKAIEVPRGLRTGPRASVYSIR